MNRQYDVTIIGGCGHVGLPLGLVLADKGLNVFLCDTDCEAGRKVNMKIMPFVENGAQEILERVVGKTLFYNDHVPNRTFGGTTLDKILTNTSIIIITIGTPIDEFSQPRFLQIVELVQSLVPYLTDQHVILRSTVYPGTCWRIRAILPQTVRFSYCPERIVEGQAIEELQQLPQIVGTYDPGSSTEAAMLFGRLGVETIRCRPEEAELAKLFLNTWRYIQFGAANDFYRIATERGLDYQRVFRVMRTGYERAASIPKPGFAAGPCLLKDTMQIVAFDERGFPLGQAARQANEGLPDVILKKIGSVMPRRVGILGMTFKDGVDDIRDSLSFRLSKLLRFNGYDVVCSDPYYQRDDFKPVEEVLKSDVVVVAVPHQSYRGMVVTNRYVIDLWDVTIGGTRL